MKYLNDYTRAIIITCRRDHHTLLLSALPFIKTVDVKLPDEKHYQEVSCFFNTLHVSGTVRGCQEKLLKLNLKRKEEFLREARTGEERRRIEEAFKDAESSDEEEE